MTNEEWSERAVRQTTGELRERIFRHPDNEQPFELVFREGSMGMVIVDLETRVLEVNRAFCRMLGYTPADLIGKESSYYTHPDDLGINAEVVRELFGGKSSVFRGKKRYIRKDGAVMWARVTGTVIRDGEGNPLYGLGMVEDISEQRSAEETIRQTNQELQIRAATEHEHIQRFDHVFEMGPIGVCIAGPDLKLSRVNKPMCDMTGYTEEELTGITFEQITHPDDVDTDVALAGQLFRGEIPFCQIEKRYIRKDGSICWVHLTASLVRDEDGVPLYGLAMVNDIHERKIAAEAVARATRLFEDAENIAGLGSWEMDLETGKSYLSDLACRIFGVEVRKPFHTSDDMRTQIHPEDLEVSQKAYESLLENGEPIQVEYRIRPGDELHFVQVRARLETINGQPHRIVGIVRDITEIRKLERHFLQAQRMEAVGTLAGGVAHDFNNILTVISGYASLMQQQLPEDSTLQTNLRAQSTAVDRAAALTRQLLTFSRKQRFEPRVVDLNDVIRELSVVLLRTVGEDVDLVTTLASKGQIEADPAQLEQVIVNLVVNARHAMSGGGKLKIETEDVTLGTKSALLLDDIKGGEYVRLSVTDTGIGMSPETAAQIFEPFFTTKEKGRGTGLGLAAVYGIIKQTKGAITVESDPGSGTVFKIYLPHTSTDAMKSGPIDSLKASPEGEGTIVLVEDDEDLRALFAKVLREAGYTVIDFADGQDALQCGQEDSIDLVITDVVMPGMSGPQFVGRVRGSHPGLRVLYMSGYTGNELDARPLEKGDRLLEKPFAPKRLLQVVNEVLRGDRPAKP